MHTPFGRRTDRQSIFGSILGSALGDAIGELVLYTAQTGCIRDAELHRIPTKEKLLSLIKKMPQLRYTDDTAMCIGVIESILEAGKVEERCTGDRFRHNHEEEPWRGYANGPPLIFLQMEQSGMSYSEAARFVGEKLFGPGGSFGNGATMRAGPLGLFDRGDRNENVRIATRITHTHPLAEEGARLVAHAVFLARRQKPPFNSNSFFSSLACFCTTDAFKEKLQATERLVAEDSQVAAEALGRGDTVLDSVPFALYAFAKYPDSFEHCLFTAVLNGGDCDTLGAMACAISGAYLGDHALPRRWLRKLENRRYLQELSHGLWLLNQNRNLPERLIHRLQDERIGSLEELPPQ